MLGGDRHLSYLMMVSEPQASSAITLKTVMVLSIGVGILAVINVPVIFDFFGKGLIYKLLYIGKDDNIPAWYSSMMLAVAALLAFECRNIAKNLQDWDKSVFLIFGLLLLFMSCDEIARFHETLPQVLTNRLGLQDLNPFTGHGWVFLGGPFVIALLISVVIALDRVLRRNRTSQILMKTGFAAIILGGVILEAAIVFFPKGILWEIETLLEEVLELTGTLLICSSLILWRDSISESQDTKETTG